MEGLAAAVDLPYARYMIEKSIELDPELNGGQGLMLIGTIECTMPQAVGGRPKLGMALMERAAAMENRTNHGILVAEAQRCAVALQDRKMFQKLLAEVIEGGDVEKYRLPTSSLAMLPSVCSSKPTSCSTTESSVARPRAVPGAAGELGSGLHESGERTE